MKTETRREVPDWVLVTVAILLIMAVLGAIVWGVVALINASQPDPGPGAEKISWQCTEFGDRLYWRTGYATRGFAVVAGGCRP